MVTHEDVQVLATYRKKRGFLALGNECEVIVTNNGDEHVSVSIFDINKDTQFSYAGIPLVLVHLGPGETSRYTLDRHQYLYVKFMGAELALVTNYD